MGPVELESGREAYAARAWLDAYTALSNADRARSLEADDVELLAIAASMVGRMDELLTLLERAHDSFLDAGESLRAARCAFWLGLNLALRGEVGAAGGWFGRAERLVEREGKECVEQGYLLLPAAIQAELSGNFEAAMTLRPRPLRSASGSVTQISLQLRCTSRAWLESARRASPKDFVSWTRRWSRSPRARSLRSSPASSTAA